MIAIEVVWAEPQQQCLLALELPEGSVVSDALAAARPRLPVAALDASGLVIGVWGQVEKSPQTRVLQPGDRIELYRPLLIDPMAARKARAEKVRQRRAS